MDYVQEDFENMTKELDKWRAEVATQQVKLDEEKRITDQSLRPLNDKLTELDQSIKDILLKINTAKANVEKNDEFITKMLRMVVHHE
jgi:TRAF3-interacting protein 1